MDGDGKTARRRVGLRRSIALTAISLAMVPVALLAAGAEAELPPASSRYALGSTGMVVAHDIALRHWGGEACGGRVEVVWGTDEPSINARSYWANPRSAYDHPQLNVQCRVVFNTALGFSWEKFCTVYVHEYGHLMGRPHVEDGGDVMSPIYRAPLEACAATPDPAAAPEPAAASRTLTESDAPAAQPRRRPSRRSAARALRRRSKARAAAAPGPLRTWSSEPRVH